MNQDHDYQELTDRVREYDRLRKIEVEQQHELDFEITDSVGNILLDKRELGLGKRLWYILSGRQSISQAWQYERQLRRDLHEAHDHLREQLEALKHVRTSIAANHYTQHIDHVIETFLISHNPFYARDHAYHFLVKQLMSTLAQSQEAVKQAEITIDELALDKMELMGFDYLRDYREHPDLCATIQNALASMRTLQAYVQSYQKKAEEFQDLPFPSTPVTMYYPPAELPDPDTLLATIHTAKSYIEGRLLAHQPLQETLSSHVREAVATVRRGILK